MADVDVLADGRNINDLKVTELRDELESRNLSKVGNKFQLQERLREFLKSGEGESAANDAEVAEEANEDEDEDGPTTNGEAETSQPVKEEQPSTAESQEAMDATSADSAPAPKNEPEDFTKDVTGDEEMEPGAAAVADADLSPEDAFKQRLARSALTDEIKEAINALIESGNVAQSDLDDRVVEIIAAVHDVAQQKWLIEQLTALNFMGVTNKPSYITAIVRAFRDRVRNMGPAGAMAGTLVGYPPKEALTELIERTNYPLEVTVGQRKYGGPPPDYNIEEIKEPGHEVECYVGHIPREMFEPDLVPLFEQCGKIHDLRLMMDSNTGQPRGYAFVTYCEKGGAAAAKEKYDNYEIKPGKHLKVNVSVANTRIFLGNIPKQKTKEELLTELQALTDGITDVIVYKPPEENTNRQNRGFCFVQFDTHKNASDAKRRLERGRIRPWNTELVIDWAESQDEDEDAMKKVKVLYVRNLTEATTEESLKEAFAPFGEIEKVNRIRDFGFVHFAERDDALKAIEEMHEKELGSSKISVQLARPQNQQRRDQQKNFGQPGFNSYRGGRGNQRGGFGRGGGRGGYGGQGGWGGGGYGQGGAAGYGQSPYGGAAGYDYSAYYGGAGAGGGYGGYSQYDYASAGYGSGYPQQQGYGGGGGGGGRGRGRGGFGGGYNNRGSSGGGNRGNFGRGGFKRPAPDGGFGGSGGGAEKRQNI